MSYTNDSFVREDDYCDPRSARGGNPRRNDPQLEMTYLESESERQLPSRPDPPKPLKRYDSKGVSSSSSKQQPEQALAEDSFQALRQSIDENSGPRKLSRPMRSERLQSMDIEEPDDEEDSPEKEKTGPFDFIRKFPVYRRSFFEKVSEYSSYIKLALGVCFLIGLVVFNVFTFLYCDERKICGEDEWSLIVIDVIVFLLLVSAIVTRISRGQITEKVDLFCTEKVAMWTRRGIAIVGFSFIIIFVPVDIFMNGRYDNLRSLLGLACLWIFGALFSWFPDKISPRAVFGGFLLQFTFGILVLRVSWGRTAFRWLGDRVSEFLAHTDAGSSFVFGYLATDGVFAFSVVPIIVFFSSVVSILFYFGWLQKVTRAIGTVMSSAMGTGPGESVNAAANIFVGQTEAPFVIKPFLKTMSISELHAVMTGGFATIAGSVLGAYIQMGISANHLLTACVMAAPGALSMSKLLYPETRTEKEMAQAAREFNNENEEEGAEKQEFNNFLEAACHGAMQSVKMVSAVVVNLIAFRALLDFVDRSFVWAGNRIGMVEPEFEPLSFQMICSYVLWPIPYVIGAAAEDCRKVARLIGLKVFLNEFIAFEALGLYSANKLVYNDYLSNFNQTENPPVTMPNQDVFLPATNVTLITGVMASDRSSQLATYALCGFANVSSIGVMLGGLGALVPSRRGDLSKTVVSALIAGTMANFISACIAGVLME